MTAKEKLPARVESLTEQEAEQILEFIARRGESFEQRLHSRPEEDEPLSDADIAAGDTVSFEQLRQELRRDAA